MRLLSHYARPVSGKWTRNGHSGQVASETFCWHLSEVPTYRTAEGRANPRWNM